MLQVIMKMKRMVYKRFENIKENYSTNLLCKIIFMILILLHQEDTDTIVYSIIYFSKKNITMIQILIRIFALNVTPY